MKSIILAFFLITSINTFSQTKAEKEAKLKAYIYGGALPELNGSWKAYSLTIDNKTYYSDKIQEQTKDLYIISTQKKNLFQLTIL